MSAALGAASRPAARASERVKVVVRCRPMSSKEQADGRQKVVDMDKKRGAVRFSCAMPGCGE